MDTCGVVQKRVSVSAGNGDAWQFYRKSDFYPRLTVLEQTDRQTDNYDERYFYAGNP